jgi:hypothetical protein
MRGGIIRQDAGAKAPGDAGRTCESDFIPLQTLHRCVGFEQARSRPDDVPESLLRGEQFLGADAPRDEDYARSVVFVGPRFEVLRGWMTCWTPLSKTGPASPYESPPR